MSDKLFEYKDPQDWYIAQWGEDADYNFSLPRILKDSLSIYR